jgi:hypothetical protein
MGPACNAASPREGEEEVLEESLAWREHDQGTDTSVE